MSGLWVKIKSACELFANYVIEIHTPVHPQMLFEYYMIASRLLIAAIPIHVNELFTSVSLWRNGIVSRVMGVGVMKGRV